MKDLPLGKAVAYPDTYDPGLLVPIPRAENRRTLGIDNDRSLPFGGADYWNMYELSWLDPTGKPEVAMLSLVIPCESPNIVESKSLKLYFGSFNQSCFQDGESVIERVRGDLGDVLGITPVVHYRLLDDASSALLHLPEGKSLDEQAVEVTHYHPEPELLGAQQGGAEPVEEQLYSNLFRSNCPITNQPDWATVTIHYRGAAIDHAGLLRYLISYRQHNDFHENCVERIFLDIMARCAPEWLTVTANFTRRGGIDINPLRTTAPAGQHETQLPRYPRQ